MEAGLPSCFPKGSIGLRPQGGWDIIALLPMYAPECHLDTLGYTSFRLGIMHGLVPPTCRHEVPSVLASKLPQRCGICFGSDLSLMLSLRESICFTRQRSESVETSLNLQQSQPILRILLTLGFSKGILPRSYYSFQIGSMPCGFTRNFDTTTQVLESPTSVSQAAPQSGNYPHWLPGLRRGEFRGRPAKVLMPSQAWAIP